jgi:hypothetical protein
MILSGVHEERNCVKAAKRLLKTDAASALCNRCTSHLFRVVVTIKRESARTTLGTPGGSNAAKKELWPRP